MIIPTEYTNLAYQYSVVIIKSIYLRKISRIKKKLKYIIRILCCKE